MNTILTTITATTTVETFVPEAVEGKVRFHTVRSNGSTRRVQFLAEGTADREVAEWVLAQREEGATMKAIAAEMHVSVPTVRRMINALLLTQEMEEADTEDLAEILADAAVEEEATSTEAAPVEAAAATA